MSEIQNIFTEFEKEISFNSKEIDVFFNKVEFIQDIINKSFKKKNLPTFYFDLHGSFKTKTMIKNHKKSTDIDFGIYYSSLPKYSSKELKSLLAQTVRLNNAVVENRDKLVRIKFEDGIQIDITQYYLTDEDTIPRLARENSWMPSDPVKLYNWFLEISRKDSNIVSLVKFYKYWASLNKIKTPSGTAFSVWVGSHIKYSRDIDESLFETSKSMLKALKHGVYCHNPIRPGDNLVCNLQPRQRKNFFNMLNKLVDDSYRAINEKDVSKSIQYWKTIFGDQFQINN